MTPMPVEGEKKWDTNNQGLRASRKCSNQLLSARRRNGRYLDIKSA